MSSKKVEKQDTRRTILEAARDLLENPQSGIPSIGQVATRAGVSRQAVYLHFPSRAELLIEAIRFIDEEHGLPGRLEGIYSEKNGPSMLDRCVEVWGEYLPHIQGISAALLEMRDSDESVAEAWQETVRCLSEVCRDCIRRLASEGKLASDWDESRATSLMAGMLSIPCWDELRRGGWSTETYVMNMKLAVRRVFVR
ncbi:MAG: TetR/AcrR family transcriptional regulator [Leptospiraceae bacterium]|nr:TetR/AcrR family transcriptional regulator [Leptospiraceae bacterium]